MTTATNITITQAEAILLCHALSSYHDSFPTAERRMHEDIRTLRHRIENEIGIEQCDRCEDFFRCTKPLGRFADPICPDCERTLHDSWKPYR